MLSRRDLFQGAIATLALTSGLGAGAARARSAGGVPDMAALVDQDPFGQVTLLNITDLHAQTMPLYHREPPLTFAAGPVAAERVSWGTPCGGTLCAGSIADYALGQDDFDGLARHLGPMGGVAHLASVVERIRQDRPGQTLFIDCGDSLQGSYEAQHSGGMDMVAVLNALGVEVTTGHWEFTYGPQRLQTLIAALDAQFLCANVRDDPWDEAVFPSTAFFDRGGVTVAVIGQAYPYTPIANPRYLVGPWSFGVRPHALQQTVDAARAQGADVVVLASHNGLALDHWLASRLRGVDVILSGHTHEALPQVIRQGDTLLVAAGSHGKFLARLDLEVRDGRVSGHRFRLIPILAQSIPADPHLAALVAAQRAPHRPILDSVYGIAEHTLYRQGLLGGPIDDLLCAALLRTYHADIALSPGFRWGTALPAGMEITGDLIHNATALSYDATTLRTLTGADIKAVLEDVADNVFHPNPLYRQGGDMVRSAGLSYRLLPHRPLGERIQNLTLSRTGEPIDGSRHYRVAGWASLADPQGPVAPPQGAGGAVESVLQAPISWGPAMSTVCIQALEAFGSKALLAPTVDHIDLIWS